MSQQSLRRSHSSSSNFAHRTTNQPQHANSSNRNAGNPSHQSSYHARSVQFQSQPNPSLSKPKTGDDNLDKQYKHIDVYGSKFALQVKPHETQRKGWSTLLLEAAARCKPNDLNDRTYNWTKGVKISFQLTLDELPMLISVLFGFAPSVGFKNHGSDRSKGFSIAFQNDKYFATLFEKSKNAHGIPIPMMDALHIGHLALSQYIANFDDLDSQTAIHNIKNYTNLMLRSNVFPVLPG